MGPFLGKSLLDASPAMLARHADYVKKLVGAEHVSFGSDHVADSVLEGAIALIKSNPTAWPKSMGYGMDSQLSPPSIVWGIDVELEKTHGWTEDEIRGFLGRNALRVYKANWK
jgi:microsomal dipeptidase-like Zn-dependent dipeptidase